MSNEEIKSLIKWQRISVDESEVVERGKVLGGWLVKVMSSNGFLSTSFVPDANHAWEKGYKSVVEIRREEKAAREEDRKKQEEALEKKRKDAERERQKEKEAEKKETIERKNATKAKSQKVDELIKAIPGDLSSRKGTFYPPKEDKAEDKE